MWVSWYVACMIYATVAVSASDRVRALQQQQHIYSIIACVCAGIWIKAKNKKNNNISIYGNSRATNLFKLLLIWLMRYRWCAMSLKQRCCNRSRLSSSSKYSVFTSYTLVTTHAKHAYAKRNLGTNKQKKNTMNEYFTSFDTIVVDLFIRKHIDCVCVCFGLQTISIANMKLLYDLFSA